MQKLLRIGVVVLLAAVATATVFATSQREVGEPGADVLSIWSHRGGKDFDASPTYIRMQEVLGIEVEFTHPAKGQEAEQFSLMLASGQLPGTTTREVLRERLKRGLLRRLMKRQFVPMLQTTTEPLRRMVR